MNASQAAHGYLSQGLSIIPLNGKIPAIKWTEYQNRVATTEEVADWFKDGKNIGIVTGELSGLAVVDFDTEAAFQDAMKRGLPHGPLVKTGRGYHLYCQHNEGLRNFQKRDDLPGIDLRAEGGQVVAPPSIHANGRRYEWLVGLTDAVLPEIPKWLLATPSERTKIKDLYTGSDTGSRNDSLARIVGSWVNDGGTFEEILSQSMLWNESNKPPLTADEIRKTVKSIFETHRRNKSTPRPITVINIKEFLALDIPIRGHLLEPVIPQQGLAMIFAPRGIGKTHLSFGIAHAVASGGTFLKWSAPEPKGVLLLDGEMPAKTLQERLARIVLSNEKEPTAPLRIVTPDLQESGMLNLSDAEDQENLTQYLDDVELIIVDNLSTLCRSGRENEAESWLPVQAWALQQRAAGRSVLFIHHSGKNGEQRGTSRREDVLDTVLKLKQPGDYTPDRGANFEVHFVKSRGVFGDATKPFEVQLSVSPDGRDEWTIKSLELSTAEKVADLLNEGIPQQEIADLLDISKGYVSKSKKQAQALGLLI